MFEDAELGVDDQEVIDSELPEGQEQESDEEEITIGQPEAPTGEDEESDETPVIRKMREELKAKAKRERELAKQLEELQATKQSEEPEPQVLPEKSLAEFDYDEQAFVDYYNKRAESIVKHNGYVAKQTQKQAELQTQYQARIAAYTAQKDELKVPKERMAEAEDNVRNSLDVSKQNLLLQTSIPARLVYAIGNSPEHLAKLADIKDRDEFNRELGRIEGQIVTTKRKVSTPNPEKRLGAGSSSSVNRDQARLDELANDPTKFSEYRALKKKMAANRKE